jgi:hypothetical protein
VNSLSAKLCLLYLTGSNKEWNSKDRNYYITENQMPSRRRKVTYANNYDIAITMTPLLSSDVPLKDLTVSTIPNSTATSLNHPSASIRKSFNLFSQPKREEGSPRERTEGPVSTVLEQQIRNLRENQELQQQQIRRQQLLQLQLEQQLELQQRQQEELQRSLRQGSNATQGDETAEGSSSALAHDSTSEPPPNAAEGQPETLLDSITNGFWAFSRQLSTLTTAYDTISQDVVNAFTPQASPRHPDASDDPADEERLSETNNAGAAGALPKIGVRDLDIDLEIAMTGGRRHHDENVSQHYQMSDHYYAIPSNPTANEESEINRRDGRLQYFLPPATRRPSPPTRLTSASFGVVMIPSTNTSTDTLQQSAQATASSTPAIVRPLPPSSSTSNRPSDGIELTNTNSSSSSSSITSKLFSKFAASSLPLTSSSGVNLPSVDKAHGGQTPSQIVAEVTYMRATGGSILNKPLGLRCYLQRVQHARTVYYVNQVYGTENDANANIIADRPDGPVQDEDNNAPSTAINKLSDGADDDEADDHDMDKAQADEPLVPATSETLHKDDDGNNGEECVICLSDPRVVALYPCRHTCLCLDCATNLSAGGNKCPICRRQVNLLLNLKPGASSSRPTISLPDLVTPVNAMATAGSPHPRTPMPSTPLANRRVSAVVPTTISPSSSASPSPRASVPGRRGGVRRTY